VSVKVGDSLVSGTRRRESQLKNGASTIALDI